MKRKTNVPGRSIVKILLDSLNYNVKIKYKLEVKLLLYVQTRGNICTLCFPIPLNLSLKLSVFYYGANLNSIMGEFVALALSQTVANVLFIHLFIINPYFSNVLTLSQSKASLRNSATQKVEKKKEWFTYSEATNFQWKNNPKVMIYTGPG